jgi:hypothetical protein
MTKSAAKDKDTVGLTGQVPMYAQPEALDSTKHAKLGMRSTPTPFGFAAKLNNFPLQIVEFSVAAVSYPIIFAGEAKQPLAVCGLAEGQNFFIDENGGFRLGAYVPSFVRRYPFVSAVDHQNKRAIVCIDRASDLWTEDKPDVLLFENGQPTDYTKSCIEFCGQYDIDSRTTENFVEMVKALDLFELKQAFHTPRKEDGTFAEPQPVAEFYAISEEKLKALPTGKLVELRDNGALGQIYAHLISQNNWEWVIQQALVRAAAAA